MNQVAPISPGRELPRKRSRKTIALTHAPFAMLWTGVLCVHLLSAMGLATFSELYWFLGKPEMSYYASFLGPSDASRLRGFAYPFGILALVHTLIIVRMLWASSTHGALMFATMPRRGQVTHRRVSTSNPFTAPEPSLGPTANHLPVAPNQPETSTRSFTGLFGDTVRKIGGLFAIHSTHFHHFHALREAIEVCVQVNQAYWSSKLVSRSSINHALVALLVINSWSTPLIHAVLGHGMQSTNAQLTCRVVCLLVDAFLDATSAIIMPLMMLAPYWHKFQFDVFEFPLIDMYDDAFFVSVVKESAMIATATVGGLLGRLIPHLSVLTCCLSIQQVITAVDADLFPRRTSSATTRAAVLLQKPKSHVAFDLLLGFVGVAVLVVHANEHVRLQAFPADPFCQLLMAPWLATKYPCAVYTFDCEHFNCTTPSPSDLSFLEADTMIKFNIAHCSSLVMPKDIQNFYNVIGMTFKYVTLVDWTRDAAVTPEYHPALIYLGFGHVNLSEIPNGILVSLPPLLQDIEFTHTNLTAMPDNLDVYWSNVMLVYMEFSELTFVPDALMRLPLLFDLSLVGNKLTNVSALANLPSSVKTVALDHNPIDTMPTALAHGTNVTISDFSMTNTHMQTVPTELLASIETLYLAGTPYCVQTTAVPSGINCGSKFWASEGKCYIL